MADDAPDSLFDTSAPAMAARLLRFRAVSHDERIAHAQQSLVMAVSDVNDAIVLANTRAELDQLRETIETAIATLCVSSTVALTNAAFLSERR